MSLSFPHLPVLDLTDCTENFEAMEVALPCLPVHSLHDVTLNFEALQASSGKTTTIIATTEESILWGENEGKWGEEEGFWGIANVTGQTSSTIISAQDMAFRHLPVTSLTDVTHNFEQLLS